MSQDAIIKIGPYKIAEELGTGGDSVVYRGTLDEIGRQVAIKVLRPERYGYEDPVRRLSNEAKAVNLINHPSVVQIYEVGILPSGQYYIVMEYIRGESLAQRLSKHGMADASSALTFLSEMSSIFVDIHKKGVIHRDIKPKNIMFSEDPMIAAGNRIKVIDFGLAKIPKQNQDHGSTSTGYFMGTERYASPEQILDTSRVDDKTDVYSLGIVIYEMLTGIAPKPDYIYQRPVKPVSEIAKDSAGPLSDIVAKMLLLKPNERPSMIQIKESCERIQQISPAFALQSQSNSSSSSLFITEKSTDRTWELLSKIPTSERNQIMIVFQTIADARTQTPNAKLTKLDREVNSATFELATRDQTAQLIIVPIEEISCAWRVNIDSLTTWCVKLKGIYHTVNRGNAVYYLPTANR